MNRCANCGKQFEGEVEFAIHRDGFGIGPEVPLCIDCGAFPLPTCEEIWLNIADRRARRAYEARSKLHTNRAMHR
jgi:NAD-dependent SIR2 family protein deacetylase